MTESTSSPPPKTRLRILFSPARLTLFFLSIVILASANFVYMANDGSPEWLGLCSVVPIFAFAIWQIVTDTKLRRRDRDVDKAPASHVG